VIYTPWQWFNGKSTKKGSFSHYIENQILIFKSQDKKNKYKEEVIL